MARPRKKETEEKHLTRLITDIIKENPDLSDIGTIIGCLGEGSIKDLEELKKSCSSIDDFLEIARKRADVALVVAAIKAAIGYDYEEIEERISKVPKRGMDDKVIICDVITGVTRRKKHAKKSDALLKFLLMNRLPEFFSDTKKVEINKKVIEIKGNTEEEIRRFAGGLLKAIDVDFIEIDNENIKNM